MTEPPPPPPPEPPVIVAELPHASPGEQHVDGTLVIDLTRLVPQPVEDCAADAPDPFNPEIVVCENSAPSPRLGPRVGPVDDGFGSAVPRARIKLSDTASAEANLINQGVGGFDADGGEVRLKIDF